MITHISCLAANVFSSYLIVAKTMAVRDAHQTWRAVAHRVEALMRSQIFELKMNRNKKTLF